MDRLACNSSSFKSQLWKMQTNEWALRIDQGRDEWGLREAQRRDGSSVVCAPYGNFSLFVCLVTPTRKVKTLSLQLLFVLDSGEINVLHSLCWLWSRNTSLTRSIFRCLFPSERGEKMVCGKKEAKTGNVVNFIIHLKCQEKQTSG